MMKLKQSLADPTLELEPGGPLQDALTQIREAKDKIVHAVMQKAVDDGCYQRAKWPL
ncbi:MAG: hypothetical protein LAN64_02325 [Acidobacteriia bacterium]|nr:hypothetical protein [Terriglobia bacterium]